MGKKFTGFIVALAAVAASAVAQEHRHEGHMHHHFAADVDAFHSVLAPLWHARPGKERTRNACAKAKEMEGLARDIRSGDAAPLVAALVTMKDKCRGNPAQADAAFFDVHEAFHRLIEPPKSQ